MGWVTDRRDPYTRAGIARLRCIRCQLRQAVHQWEICADGNRWRPLCLECDIELNRLVLEFMRHPNARALGDQYEAKVRQP